MNKEEFIKTGKQIAGVVLTIGMGAIIGNAVKFTTPTSGIGAIKKLCIGAGTLALSSMASDATTKYVESKIDDTVTEVETFFKEETPEESQEGVA